MTRNHNNKNNSTRLKWDYPGDTALLEMMILRILMYDTFQDLARLYNEYSEETYKLAFKYPAVKRGVKFWVRKWHDIHV